MAPFRPSGGFPTQARLDARGEGANLRCRRVSSLTPPKAPVRGVTPLAGALWPILLASRSGLSMNRYWTLAARPLDPWPTRDTFELREAPIPAPGPGQALTRTIYVSLDPYQWGRARRGEEPEGAPCHARTVSQVLESRIAGLAAGDFVFNTNGWAEYGLMGEGVPRPGYMAPRKLDPASGKISHAVGVLGMLGLTAYAGMVLQCEPKPGDTAVVSAASGGVGQIAGQLARLKGCRVVGIAGREEKCRYVVEALGYDACVSHLSPGFAQDLKAACPDGIDV